MGNRIKALSLALALGAASVAHGGVLVEEYGDSTTQGWQVAAGGGYVTPNNEPAYLQQKLRTSLGSSVIVSNQGVGGSEASQLWDGTDGRHPPWPQQMARSHAEVVTLNFGLNDAYWSVVGKHGTRVESPEVFAAYMTKLVKTAQEFGKQVVIYEPNPTTEPIRAARMDRYVSALREVAARLNTPLVKNYSEILAMPRWPALLSDGVHPSDQLYSIKAGASYAVVAPIVAGIMRQADTASRASPTERAGASP